MSGLAITPADILRFALQQTNSGKETVLITLVTIAGSSPRALGTQMVVAADGQYRGSFSGGCIEAAIVGEALSVLASGKGRMVRFGAGSPYIDVRLPCGGGIDLLFTPQPGRRALSGILGRLDTRQAAAMRVSDDGIAAVDPADVQAGWLKDEFCVAYVPRVRIIAMGHGEALTATARLAHFFGAETRAFSPSANDVNALSAEGIDAQLLENRSQLPALDADPWTAFTFLFHDHDWEEALLPHALRSPHLLVAAIGGAHSRASRLDLLHGQGFDEAALHRFKAPAGLIPATRDPATLALSIVTEIIGEYQSLQCRARTNEHDLPLVPALDICE